MKFFSQLHLHNSSLFTQKEDLEYFPHEEKPKAAFVFEKVLFSTKFGENQKNFRI